MSQAGRKLSSGGGNLDDLVFNTDSGMAQPNADIINVFGDNGVVTAGAANVVTVALDDNTFIVNGLGEVNLPRQPAFLGYLSATDTDVTGDGTTFTVGSGNPYVEVTDQGNNFVTTGTFTAPVTGQYSLSAWLTIEILADATFDTFAAIFINTSNNIYVNTFPTRLGSPIDGEVYSITLTITVLANMDQNDTAILQVQSAAVNKDDDIIGGVPLVTGFSGFLAC